MTVSCKPTPLRAVPSSCVGVIDCVGARVSAHVRGPAIVVTVDGEIDICNSDRLASAIRDLYRPTTPLVLDLRGIEFIGVSGFRELLAFSDDCNRADVTWHLVAGRSLRPLLRVFTDHGLPVIDATLTVVGSG